MRREQYTALQDWFGGYVDASYRENPDFYSWIKLKDRHTRRVCEKIIRIGQSLEMDKNNLLLAETIALFHDVGRFKQIHLYGTFNDRKSENHAALGVRVLAEASVLEGLAEEEQKIIIKAIELHNLRDLPGGLPEKLLLFARLVRDADKLDILEVFTGYYSGENKEFDTALDSSLPDTAGYSPVLVENILQKKRCNYSDIKNRNDRKLLNLSWTYDINFDYTLSEIVNNGYIDKIIEALPPTADILAAGHHLRAYAAWRLGSTETAP